VAIEVTYLLIIIVGRWFLPKGRISRFALSQLLLVYLSLASDMIDLLSMFQEEKVIRDMNMIYSTLAVFSWSTFQFSLSLVSSRGRTFRFETDSQNIHLTSKKNQRRNNNNSSPRIKSTCQKLASSELPSIFITILMQDLPFLIIRIIAVIHFKVQSYTTIFFTCKNFIILFLQFYRLWSICIEHIDQDEQIDFDKHSTTHQLLPMRDLSNTQFISHDSRMNQIA